MTDERSSDSAPLRLSLDGLTCAGCVSRAEAALADVPGLTSASVNLATRGAVVDPGQASLADMAAALERAGYPARVGEVTLDIDGMTCAGCASRVGRALSDVPGVLSADVNFAARTAQLRFFEGMTTPSALAAASAEAGYPARPHEAEGPDRAAEDIAKARRAMLWAAALTLPVFVVEMGGHLVPAFHHWIAATIGTETSWILQFLLTSAVMAGPGRDFFRLGLPRLIRGEPDMNSLVALGSGAAWIFSTVALFAPGVLPDGTRAVYFEAAAVIVTLILTGRWLEARARGRTGAAIRGLIALRPDSALVETGESTEERAVDMLRVGDVIVIPAGRSIATDGEVLSGQSFVDESMISGEPVPAQRGPGDAVVGGTVNGNGVLRVRVGKVGADTVLSRIVAMVEAAQGARLPIQALADRVVRIFVPAVLAVAGLTILTWLVFGPSPALSHALVAGVSVLIIACPCAMGLATPTSIMVGTGRAAELGVLFRKGAALETLAGIKVIAFDKTGTLTEGRPTLTEIRTAPAWGEDDALALAAAIERSSDHPIARAIVEASQARDLAQQTVDTPDALPGLGVSLRHDGKTVLLGAPRLMTQQGIDLSGLPEAEGRAETVVFLAIDGQAAASFSVADPVKPDAARVLASLHAAGLRTAMITGDAEGPAQDIARRLGIDHVEAEVMPEDKLNAVRRLRDRFGPVAFAGDGINDAPALAEADVGLAMGTGTDIAIDSADVILVSGAVAGVANAHHVARRTLGNIRQNLFWAFAYNTALIPVAAGVLYPLTGTLLSPMLAAGAMALSSVFVLTNALRLRRIAPVMVEAPAAPTRAPITQEVTP